MSSLVDPDGLEKYRQKRRRPRTDRDLEFGPLSDVFDRAYDLVPEIGEGCRWYDPPYRFLDWISSGGRRRLFPRSVSQAAVTGINYLFPYHQHDLDKVWPLDSWLHNVFVPEDEHVTTAGIWAVELFPPSQLSRFEAALRRNGWERNRRWDPYEDDNLAILRKSRSGHGNRWWRLADVTHRGSKRPALDGIRAELPSEFRAVSVRAIQVGAGLTAVLAHFSLTDDAGRSLDREWHRKHEPILLPHERGRRRRPLDRQFAAYHETQVVRMNLHLAAREWMGFRIPGFFASNKSSQTLVDLLLFDTFDPTLEPYVELERADEIKRRDALRALALSDSEFRQVVSPRFAKLLLSPPDSGLHDAMSSDPVWTLWGSRAAVREAWGDERLSGAGGSEDRAIAHHVESMYNLIVMLAVSDLVTENERRYAELRDRASTRHGKFRPRALRDLRKILLTLSLDLGTVRRDASAFWDDEDLWRWEGGGDFVFQPTPWARARDQRGGLGPEQESSFNNYVRELQQKRLEALTVADRDYRGILSTVASLGASADAFKIGRWALWVALVSLVVAVTTIVLVDVGCNSIVHQLVGWPPADSCMVEQ